MPGPFHVSFADKGDITLVKVVGKLHGCPNFRELLYDPINEQLDHGRRKFVLDLSHTRFVDSIGVGFIMAIYASVMNADGQLVLCGLNERVLSLFHVVTLDKLYRVFDSCDEAAAALES